MTRGYIDGEYQDGEIRGINFLVGLRGTGKTTEAGRLCKLCTGGVFVFDTMARHSEVFPNYVTFCEPGPLEAYLRVNRGRRFNVRYEPRGGKLDDHAKHTSKIVIAFGWMIAFFDEIDRLCGPRFGPSWMSEEMYTLVNYGRHHRVSMLLTARRPQSIPSGIRDEAELRIFRLKKGGKALDYFKDEIGDENAARVASLPKYQYLHFVGDEDPVLRAYPL